jgi:hypothetical protein
MAHGAAMFSFLDFSKSSMMRCGFIRWFHSLVRWILVLKVFCCARMSCDVKEGSRRPRWSVVGRGVPMQNLVEYRPHQKSDPRPERPQLLNGRTVQGSSSLMFINQLRNHCEYTVTLVLHCSSLTSHIRIYLITTFDPAIPEGPCSLSSFFAS